MKTMFSKRKRLFRRIAIGIVILILVALLGLPTALAVVIVFPYSGSAGEPPQGFSEVDLITEDGVRLGAWYAEPENGAVIILTPGAGQGTSGLGDHAVMLHENGFGVLAVNLRGFGSSDGQMNRLGWNGSRDIGAAVEFLMGREEVESIGGLGLSMGAEVLIGAASEYPALQAVVAEGATCRSLDELKAVPENGNLLNSLGYRIAYFWVGVLSGDEPPAITLIESIEGAQDTEFLFVVAGTVDEEITYNGLFAEAAGEHGSLWVIPETGHTAGLKDHPEEYERRVVEFFTGALLAD
jgi:fermentation-respiration switch protein FrsA (DUF1100 family)